MSCKWPGHPATNRRVSDVWVLNFLLADVYCRSTKPKLRLLSGGQNSSILNCNRFAFVLTLRMADVRLVAQVFRFVLKKSAVMFRRFLISATLVAHATAALLGHAGLHAVMGCDHGEHAAQPSLGSAHDHRHAPCAHDGHRHHHRDEQTVPCDAKHSGDRPSSPVPSHHHDDDCLVCQFSEHHQAPLAFFHMPATADVSESTVATLVPLAPAQIELSYDSRGPPAV